MPEEQVLKALLGNDIPEGVAHSLVELGLAIHSGILREDYGQNKPAAFGKVKVAAFAKEFADVYNQQ
ncbi:MAG: hypothetical protein ACTHLB_04690 [Parafilimonas sp.]